MQSYLIPITVTVGFDGADLQFEMTDFDAPVDGETINFEMGA